MNMPTKIYRKYLVHLYRRRLWVLHKISFRKIVNLCLICFSSLFRMKKVPSLPFAIKVDTTPNCQLRCPICIHGKTIDGKPSINLANKVMPLEICEKIVSQTENVTSALCFYFLGEPFMNKKILEMVSLASEKGFSTFISSNFSFKFSSEQIKKIVDSGLTSLTVCLDGMTQEIYEQTRVGGKVDYVLSNLKGIQQYKKETNQKLPEVEVRFLKLPHNEHQLPQIKELAKSLGVENMCSSPGATGDWLESTALETDVLPRKKGFLPKCLWPWISMIVKWNGDVIPCCNYRFAEQYDDEKAKSSVIGNIRQNSIKEIWNSEQYQQIRRMVADPSKFNKDEHSNIFCYGCSYIYEKNS